MQFLDVVAIVESVKDKEVMYLKYKSVNVDGFKKCLKDVGHTLTKVTETLVIKGIKYTDQATVKEKVENGYRLTHELPWGEWNTDHPNFIDNKGNHYLRLYFPDGDLKDGKDFVAITKYFYDGNEVDRKFLKDNDLMNGSFWKPKKPQDAFNVNVENILELN